MRGSKAKALRANAQEIIKGADMKPEDTRPLYRYLKKAWYKIPRDLKGLDNPPKS